MDILLRLPRSCVVYLRWRCRRNTCRSPRKTVVKRSCSVLDVVELILPYRSALKVRVFCFVIRVTWFGVWFGKGNYGFFFKQFFSSFLIKFSVLVLPVPVRISDRPYSIHFYWHSFSYWGPVLLLLLDRFDLDFNVLFHIGQLQGLNWPQFGLTVRCFCGSWLDFLGKLTVVNTLLWYYLVLYTLSIKITLSLLIIFNISQCCL